MMVAFYFDTDCEYTLLFRLALILGSWLVIKNVIQAGGFKALDLSTNIDN